MRVDQIKIYLAVLAVANYVFVTMMVFGPQGFVYPAVTTAITLFAHGVSSKRPLTLVGSMFNFLGVVAGGLTGLTPVMYMALFGCQLLLVDHVSPLFTFKRKVFSPKTEK